MRIQPAACRFRKDRCKSTAKAKTAPTAITMSAVAAFMRAPPRLAAGAPGLCEREMPGYRNPNVQARTDFSGAGQLSRRGRRRAAARRRGALLRPGVRLLGGERPGDALQALPLGLDPEDDLDYPG